MRSGIAASCHQPVLNGSLALAQLDCNPDYRACESQPLLPDRGELQRSDRRTPHGRSVQAVRRRLGARRARRRLLRLRHRLPRLLRPWLLRGRLPRLLRPLLRPLLPGPRVRGPRCTPSSHLMPLRVVCRTWTGEQDGHCFGVAGPASCSYAGSFPASRTCSTPSRRVNSVSQGTPSSSPFH